MSGEKAGRFVTVAKVGEVPPGGVKVVRLDDREIALFRVGDAYHAMDDVCTHDGGPLAEGVLDGHVVECPRHGARFDVRTGAVLAMPATAPVRTHPVRILGGEIQVEVAVGEGTRAPDGPSAGGARPSGSPGAAGGAAGAPGAGRGAGVAAPGTPPEAAAAPSQQEMAVRSALETVMDPEINLSVIDLGLIREIRFLDPPKTLVRMMLTTPFCPYAPQLTADVRQAVMSVVPQECEVEILPDAWSPDLMPDPGLLGYSF